MTTPRRVRNLWTKLPITLRAIFAGFLILKVRRKDVFTASTQRARCPHTSLSGFSVSQIDRIRSCSRSRQVAAGDILFEPGDENVPFYVLLSGRMEIVQPDLAGEHLIAKHGPREFTGEITMISGRRCLVRGRVTEAGKFLELTGDGLRSLVARDAELSDIFLRAFILRRLQLISQGQGNVILLGSRHSPNTLRLREFLSRNGYPYRYVDLDTDNTSQ